jgi:hypothetical protein
MSDLPPLSSFLTKRFRNPINSRADCGKTLRPAQMGPWFALIRHKADEQGIPI